MPKISPPLSLHLQDDAGTRKPKILVTDDEPANIMVLLQALKTDYDAISAPNGPTAIELANAPETRPDLILMDVQMPGMSGFEACKELAKEASTRHIPVIFLTSLDSVASKTTGFDVGGVDYITKPFHIPEVLARVKTHVTLKKAVEELKKNEQKFRRLSLKDDLTGLYNTRHLYRALRDHIAYCLGQKKPLSIIFLDLDHFKHVVDTYGHLFGSQVVQEVASTIKSCLGKNDFAVSYAGDEFVVVLPHKSKEQAVAKAEQIRERMAQTPYLANRGLNLRVSASFGIASAPEDAKDQRTLLALADKTLFSVKEQDKGGIGVHKE